MTGNFKTLAKALSEVNLNLKGGKEANQHILWFGK